jgi:large repetitive protein
MQRKRPGHRGPSIPALLVAFVLAPVLFVVVPAGIAAASTVTTTTVSVPGTSTYFANASLSVTVTASGGNPTQGTVTISDSFHDFSCTDTLAGTNVATCSTGYTAVGTDTITATYSGAGSYAGSVGYANVIVSKATVSLSASATAATVGETTTVTVESSPSIAGNASGAVTISDAGYANALNCSATFSSSEASCQSGSFTSIGTDDFSVNWAGNADYYAASTSTTLSVGQASTVIESVTAQAAQVGQTTTITALVVPYPDGGNVSFSDTDRQVTGCSSEPVNSSTGIATCTTPVLTTADASDAVSATYLGDTNYAASLTGTGNLDVQRGTTQVTVSGNPTPSVGSSATYTATVTPSTAVTGGGSLAFSDTGGKITDCNAVPLTSPSCESLTYTQVGSDQVTASFDGNTNWAPSSGETTFAVAQGQPDVSVSLLPANPTVGDQVVITATVAPTDGGGSVDFSGSYISGCSAQPLSGRVAHCTTSLLTGTGSWTVTASYSGDTNYASAGAFKTVTVTAAPTTVTVGATNPSPTAFSSDSINATVTPIPDGGTVAFTDSNGTIAGCGSVAVSTSTGVASCSIASLPGAGTYDISASYGGDGNYLANSNELALAISRIPTTVLVAPSTNPVTVGQSTTITITVSPVPDSGGSVTVTDSLHDVSCSNVTIPVTGPSAGTATCSATNLSPAGTDSLTSSFSGTTNYSSASGSGSITVNRLTSTTVISSADSYGLLGGQLHLSATISPVPSNGYVTFSDSLGQFGACASVPVNGTTGIASCTTGTLTLTGSDLISVTFQQTATEATSTTGTTIPIEEDASIAGSLSFTETVGSPAAGSVDTTGYPAPSVTAGANLPSGMTLTTDGVLSGSPAFGSGGVYSVPISATNSLNTASATATIVVDQVPSVSSATSLSAAYGEPSTFIVTTASGTYPTAAYALSGALPSGMTITDNRDGTATISGVPSNYVSGLQSFSLLVFNSVGSVSVPFMIDVTGTPSQPTSPSSSSPPTSPTTPTSTSSAGNGTGLSSLSEALALHRSEAVASAGRQPKVTVRGTLPTTWDPIARRKVVHSNGKTTSVPIVALGSDSRFPVLGNVGPYGDCAVVADSNIVRIEHVLGKVKTIPAMTTKQALAAWNTIDGGDGAGLTDAQLLNAWSSATGLLGTRITGWRELNPANLGVLKEAIKADGALYAGIVLPGAGVVGNTIDPTLTASSEVSGHGLTLFGWTPKGLLGVSWGEVVMIPYSWWSKYSTTSYAVNTPQLVKSPTKR